MTWRNRVAWQEGMFLRAQHFQQQDRWAEAQLHGSLAAVVPLAWGFADYAVSRELLGTGRFALTAASGLFEDGTLFRMPDEARLPPPLEVPRTARNALVYLALPVQLPGAPQFGVGNDGEGRFVPEDLDVTDAQSGDTDAAQLQVGRLRLRYVLETDDREGYLCLPVARVSEVAADHRVVLDDGWIPPVLGCATAQNLLNLVIELAGMLGQRGEAIAARLTATGAKSNTEVADFLLLQAVNGWQTLFADLAEAATLHPRALYRTMVEMAGGLATFTDPRRRPESFPPYRHADLQRSFAPVANAIRRSLSAVLEQTAVRIPLREPRHGVRVGPIIDRTLLSGTSIVLMARADAPTETLRRLFPSTAKVAAVEHIRELVNVALPGVDLRPLPVAPRQMPFVAGAQYFELDPSSPHWAQLRQSGGFAIHVSGDFPNLELELWAIRA